MARPDDPPEGRQGPPRCPECGGRSVEPVTEDDLERPPFGLDDEAPQVPGMMRCTRCGTIVRWGP